MPAPEKKSPGVPLWIVTFADLSTLMLTFFVLLISFSNQDVVKFREMLGSIQNAFGANEKREGQFQAVLSGNAAAEQKKKREDEKKEEEKRVKKQLAKVAKSVTRAAKESKMDEQTSITSTGEGVRIRVKGEALFDSGKVKIKSGAVKLLDGIARAIKKANLPVVVEGHTDNVPIKTALYGSNWDLSATRASRVVRYLVQIRKVPKENVMAVGYADMRPLERNDTAKGRAANRRVEFLVKKR